MNQLIIITIYSFRAKAHCKHTHQPKLTNTIPFKTNYLAYKGLNILQASLVIACSPPPNIKCIWAKKIIVNISQNWTQVKSMVNKKSLFYYSNSTSAIINELLIVKSFNIKHTIGKQLRQCHSGKF